jgi:Flp pilus assembly protein TadD
VLRKALELNPDNAFASNTKGNALRVLGRHSEGPNGIIS